MRYLLALGLFVTSWPLTETLVSAEESVTGVLIERPAPRQTTLSVALLEAYREYQQAKLQMHEYRFVTLPQQRRQLDDQIKLTEAERAVLHRRLRDYRPFLQVGRYSPVRTAAESHYLALIAAEQRLRQLKDERVALLRLSRQRSQLLRLDLLRAKAQMAMARATYQKTR